MTGRSRPGWSVPVAATRPARSWRPRWPTAYPVVVDADGLTHVPPGRAAVLTPHAGELARMLDTARDAVEARPLDHARLAAERYDAVLLLKGRHTLVAGARRPDPRHDDRGCRGWRPPAPATCSRALIGALLAAGLDPWDAASVGSWVHGAAATEASGGGPHRGGRRGRRAAGGVLRSLA